MSAAELWVAVAFGLCTFALVAACAAVWMVLLSRWVEREYRRDLDRELAYLAEWRKQKDHG